MRIHPMIYEKRTFRIVCDVCHCEETYEKFLPYKADAEMPEGWIFFHGLGNVCKKCRKD